MSRCFLWPRYHCLKCFSAVNIDFLLLKMVKKKSQRFPLLIIYNSLPECRRFWGTFRRNFYSNLHRVLLMFNMFSHIVFIKKKNWTQSFQSGPKCRPKDKRLFLCSHWKWTWFSFWFTSALIRAQSFSCSHYGYSEALRPLLLWIRGGVYMNNMFAALLVFKLYWVLNYPKDT